MYQELQKYTAKNTLFTGCGGAEGFGRFLIYTVYATDTGKSSIVTVYAYGISRCSRTDKYSATRGISIAKGRAEKALYLKLTNQPITHHYMGKGE